MNTVRIRDYYNSLIGNSDICSWYDDNSLTDIYKSFLSMLCTNPNIIDLGSGSGSEAYKLSNLGAKVLGIDCSEESVYVARKNNNRAKFIVGDITTDLSNKLKKTFDAATLILTINDLSFINLYKMLKNIKKFLKQNAYIFLIYKSSFFPYVMKNNKYFYSEKLLYCLFFHFKYRYCKMFILPNDYKNENYKCIIFKCF